MSKDERKKSTSRGGVEVEVNPEGFAVFVDLRDLKTGTRVSIKLHRSAANALRALLATAEHDDDDNFAVILRGELTVRSEQSNEAHIIPGR